MSEKLNIETMKQKFDYLKDKHVDCSTYSDTPSGLSPLNASFLFATKTFFGRECIHFLRGDKTVQQGSAIVQTIFMNGVCDALNGVSYNPPTESISDYSKYIKDIYDIGYSYK